MTRVDLVLVWAARSPAPRVRVCTGYRTAYKRVGSVHTDSLAQSESLAQSQTLTLLTWTTRLVCCELFVCLALSTHAGQHTHALSP